MGEGPTGTCIRNDLSVINDDFAACLDASPWPELAQRYGFRASASFPLRRRGRVSGAFTLYAFEPQAFDVEQVGLLESLSSDISYALDAIDHEHFRVQAEGALSKSRDELAEKVRERTAELTLAKEELEAANEGLAGRASRSTGSLRWIWSRQRKPQRPPPRPRPLPGQHVSRAAHSNECSDRFHKSPPGRYPGQGAEGSRRVSGRRRSPFWP